MHLTKANSPVYICRFREPKRVGDSLNVNRGSSGERELITALMTMIA